MFDGALKIGVAGADDMGDEVAVFMLSGRCRSGAGAVVAVETCCACLPWSCPGAGGLISSIESSMSYLSLSHNVGDSVATSCLTDRTNK